MEAFLQERMLEGKEADDARQHWRVDMAKLGKAIQAQTEGTIDPDLPPHLVGR